ncbi:nucleotidyltransferase family protein [Mangrovibacterium lignilyticum]|uniref:nucleotidyltransferase family protein n=1 Tax=Mangrovibacterium lignilyticum TaxID=2668052 RepID=UPI0013D53103|nr:nucleotidyltransferase family protein [Mangrovibacterium lignilyticum]
MAKICILLLAAGESSRMGQAKQLLPWGNSTLIEHQLEKLLATGHPVFVVLGSRADQISSLIEKYPVTMLINEQWQTGMGSSISAGVSHLMKTLPETEGILITLIDQPMVTTEYLNKLTAEFTPRLNQIIASQSADGWRGVPALFDQKYVNDLMNLKGQKGAKRLIREFSDQVICLESNQKLDDMDTTERYEQLLAEYLKNSPSIKGR